VIGNFSFTNEVIANTTIVNGVPIYNNITKLVLGESQNNLLCVNKSYTYLGGLFIIIGSIILLLNGKKIFQNFEKKKFNFFDFMKNFEIF
jgi:hypothetical protein